jgi:hypothetical protein
MKNVYVKPEVEYINFYSEETITSDDWDYSSEEGYIDNMGAGNTPTLSLVDKGDKWI